MRNARTRLYGGGDLDLFPFLTAVKTHHFFSLHRVVRWFHTF